VKKDVSRGRVRRVAILVGVLVALGSALWLTTFRRDTSRELRAAASAFLTRLGDGRASEAYAQAADQLRAEVDHGVFQLMADDLTEAAGKFKRIGRVETSQVSHDAEVTRATFVADAAFEKRELPVALTLVHREDGWRVASFLVKYPDDMWPAPDAVALAKDSTQFMKWLAEGDLGAMYARFYPDVWTTWKPSKFEGDIERLRGGCAGLHADLPTVVGTNSAGMTLVEVRTTCASGDAFVTQLKWSWLHGKWRLLGLTFAATSVKDAPSPPP